MSVYVKDSASTRPIPSAMRYNQYISNYYQIFATDKNDFLPVILYSYSNSNSKANLSTNSLSANKKVVSGHGRHQNYSEKNSVTWSVNKPGNYRLSVYVKDSASTKTCFFKTVRYNVVQTGFTRILLQHPHPILWINKWEKTSNRHIRRMANG